MYINDISILWYLVLIILGLGISCFMPYMKMQWEKGEKLFGKGKLKLFKDNFNINYKYMLVIPLVYLIILYTKGLGNNFTQNIELIKYIIIVPLLVLVFVIDYQKQIIPNRINLLIFEIGIIFSFIYGIININLFTDCILGLVVGGGAFLLITLIGGLIAGKEAMGFGDVKLMCGLGLLFGFGGTIVLMILSFLIGAILSIIILASRKKTVKDYIPFGPFIVLGTFTTMIFPLTSIVFVLLKIFTLGLI